MPEPITAPVPTPRASADSAHAEAPARKMEAHDLTVRYGTQAAIEGVSLPVADREVTALIGPSGCGKSTFLRSLNRMNDLIDGCSVRGRITLDGQDIYAPHIDAVDVRRRVGMVFQRSNPFP